MSDRFSIRDCHESDLADVCELCASLGWESYTQLERAGRAFLAPGVVAACAESDGSIVGFGYAQTDGAVQAHLSLLGVTEARRSEGIGIALVGWLLAQSGVTRLDLVTEDAAPFYASLLHKRMAGFRVYLSAPN